MDAANQEMGDAFEDAWGLILNYHILFGGAWGIPRTHAMIPLRTA